MTKTYVRLIVAFLLALCIVPAYSLLHAGESVEHAYQPKNGFVPDVETAIKIAEAVWLPIYGDVIEKEKPFKATLRDSTVWVVEGTLKNAKGGLTLGGVAYIEIQKSDCKVLRVTHGK